ncbi:hypothetical protein BJV82DRAFT_599415 [Fennellomyces sp. T-0311]|nr:hypothetical protein BJV82DRAFT_599415 [Fennellomyces sp. T-0311]
MCDLSDPKIVQAYTEIEQYEDTNWLLLGYHDTRDVISLYSKGTGGLGEFRKHLTDEVLYGFVRVDDRFILITWVSEQVSGVRRARALVHSRSVAALLKSHHAQITASSLNDVSDANIRTRLKLGENQVPNRSRPPSMSERKRSSLAARRQSQQTPPTPAAEVSDEPDSFVEASEDFPPSPREDPEALKRLRDEQLRKETAKKEREAADRKKKELERRQLEEAEQKKKQQLADEAAKKKAEAEAKKKADADAAAKKKSADAEAKKKAEAEKHRLEEQKAMKRRMEEAEKNKDVMLVGFASVQPSTSPFWRRRYIMIRGKNLIFYRDELNPTPVSVIDLRTVTRLSPIDHERETFVPNAFVMETQKEGSYQLFADSKRDCTTILTALQTVISA